MTEVKWHAVVIQTKDAEEPPSSHVIRYNWKKGAQVCLLI